MSDERHFSSKELIQRLRQWSDTEWLHQFSIGDRKESWTVTRDCADAAEEIERLTSQLPPEMLGRKLQFIECEKGHGRITAENWVDHGCHWCMIERLRLQVSAWERLNDQRHAHEPRPAPKRMRMAYQLQGRCMWHEDCEKSRSGIMREVAREELRSLFECLHCGQRGYYSVGAVGAVCVDVVGSSCGDFL